VLRKIDFPLKRRCWWIGTRRVCGN